MHSVRVSLARSHALALVAAGNSPWVARLVALAAFVAVWLGAGRASAAEVSLVSGVSSAAAPPMSPRGPEPTIARVDGVAPLCDIRCATTFAPAPQYQDSEVTLAVTDADDDGALEAARMVPGGSHESQVSQGDPCILALPGASAAPAGAELSKIPVVAAVIRPGVVVSLERPPRA